MYSVAGVRPLSYTILLEEVLAEKKCPQKPTSYPGAFSMRLDYTRLRVRTGEKLEKALEKAAHVATKYFKIASYESVWQGGVAN